MNADERRSEGWEVREMEMKTKVYRAPVHIKADDGDGEKGEFAAVFATLNVVDHDEDVTLPGAFGSQRVLVEPWNHNYQQPPVGKGVITEEKDQAIVSGRFFLDTAAGREHYTVVKDLGDMQEWSYTFRILDAEPGMFDGAPVRLLKRLEVIGVSPVTEGAGIDTHTVAIKGAKPVDVTEDTIRIRMRDPEDFQADSFRTITISADDYIKAVIGKLKGETKTTVQSYLFDKEHWTVEEAQAWVKEHGKQRGTEKCAAYDESGGDGDEAKDGKSSGWAPRDVQVQLEILRLSTEV